MSTVLSVAAAADLLTARILAEAPMLRHGYVRTAAEGVGCTWLDEVLPEAVFAQLAAAIPPAAGMTRRRSLGERKYVSARTERMPAIASAMAEALASPRLAETLGEVLGVPGLTADPELYNAGLTVMTPADFMRPHLDNSHDRAGVHPRRLVALFYVAAEWRADWNGALILWRGRGRTDPLIVPYRPNRLVLFESNEQAWHSVGRIDGPAARINLTAYFYDRRRGGRPRLTRFAGWPGERVAHAALAMQFGARSLAARLGLRRLSRNAHVREERRRA